VTLQSEFAENIVLPCSVFWAYDTLDHEILFIRLATQYCLFVLQPILCIFQKLLNGTILATMAIQTISKSVYQLLYRKFFDSEK